MSVIQGSKSKIKSQIVVIVILPWDFGKLSSMGIQPVLKIHLWN